MDLNIDWTTLGFRGAKELMSHDWKRLRNISLSKYKITKITITLAIRV